MGPLPLKSWIRVANVWALLLSYMFKLALARVTAELKARMLVPIAVEVRLRVSGGFWNRLHHMTYIRKLFAPGVAVYKAALLRKDGYFDLQSASYLDGHREWPRKLNLWLLCLAGTRGVAGSNT